MQFVDITKGSKTKRITEFAWAREQHKRYKDWQLAGTVTNNPSPKAQRFPAPESIQRKPFLPPELQTLRPKIPAPVTVQSVPPVVTTTVDPLPDPVQVAPEPVSAAPEVTAEPQPAPGPIRRGAAKKASAQ